MILTRKQENFAQSIFLGMSQHDAYLQSYDAGKMLPSTVDRNACELAKNNKVAARIEELRSKTETFNVLTVTQRQELLSKFAGENNITDKGNINRAPNIASVAELNKMTGAYPAEKHALALLGGIDLVVRYVEKGEE